MKTFTASTLVAVMALAGPLVSAVAVEQIGNGNANLATAVDSLERVVNDRLGLGQIANQLEPKKRQIGLPQVGSASNALSGPLSQLQGQLGSQSNSIFDTLEGLGNGQLPENDGLQSVLGSLGGTQQSLADVLVDVGNAAGLNLPRGDTNALVDILVDIVDQVLDIIEQVVDQLGLRPEIAQALDSVVQVLGQLLVGVDGAVDGLGDGVLDILDPILNGLGGLLQPVLEPVTELLDQIAGNNNLPLQAGILTNN